MKKEIKLACYDEFRCIADRCSITCCQEWNIAVDDKTCSKWKKLNMIDKLTKKEGAHVIRLDEARRCPYLTEEKLCSIVIDHGEDSIPRTCRIFPRQISEYDDRMEYSLTACCPEVVDMFQKLDRLELIGDINRENTLELIRELMMELMQTKSLDVNKKLMITFYYLLDIREKRISKPEMLMKYIDEHDVMEVARTIDGMEFHNVETFREDNELFLDMVENYKKSGMYKQFFEDIVQIAERLDENFDDVIIEERIEAFNKEYRKYDTLIQNLVTAEIYSGTLSSESYLEGVIVKTQWIAMEYAIVRHAILLRWLADGAGGLRYEPLRDMIVIISRATGYNDEDIMEYMLNNFRNMIWDWGYLALVVGRLE